MCALKLMAMPAIAFAMAKLLNLPPLAAGVVVLLAAATLPVVVAIVAGVK